MLIACADADQLLLSRLAQRAQELMVRTALGASRARLVQQLITECCLLTLTATAAGLGVANWAAQLVSLAQPAPYPASGIPFSIGAAGLRAERRFLLDYCSASCPPRSWAVCCWSRCSAQPAWLHGGGAGRMRAVLIAMQAALAVVLVAGSVTMGRSFLKLLGIDWDTTPITW